MLEFVVTGCASSSTKWTATALTAAGLTTTHEEVNGWDASWHTRHDWRELPHDGDSSWIAAPFAPQLQADGLTVVHLVRHPLAIVRSIVGQGWLANDRQPFVQFVYHHTPRVRIPRLRPTRALVYWVEWNRLLDGHADLTWTCPASADDVLDLADLVGVDLDPVRVAEATDMAAIHGRQRADVAASKLPAGLYSQALDMWADYSGP